MVNLYPVEDSRSAEASRRVFLCFIKIGGKGVQTWDGSPFWALKGSRFWPLDIKNVLVTLREEQ